MGGTGRGSCMVNTIWGVFGSARPLPSVVAHHRHGDRKGLRIRPHTSTMSPAANLFRRLRVASPFSSQFVTTAQICQSRRYRALS